jgi:hypothetical protein
MEVALRSQRRPPWLLHCARALLSSCSLFRAFHTLSPLFHTLSVRVARPQPNSSPWPHMCPEWTISGARQELRLRSGLRREIPAPVTQTVQRRWQQCGKRCPHCWSKCCSNTIRMCWRPCMMDGSTARADVAARGNHSWIQQCDWQQRRQFASERR